MSALPPKADIADRPISGGAGLEHPSRSVTHPGGLLINPKAHVVYEYYWPLATSNSFDPQPGSDTHVIAREQPHKELRKERPRV
jgi:hypothetical protein